jgi:glycosyltransferase involved in cell wall biosynthesis
MAPGQAGADQALAPRAGDRFLGLDLIRDRTAIARPALERLRGKGVALSFVVYDLLPLQGPDWFPAAVAANFREWLQMVSALADQLLCISESVARDLRKILARDMPGTGPRISSFTLGADLDTFSSARLRPSSGKPDTPRLLMVGTVEPRKGHEQALEACEMLWQRGRDLELVIVGRAGWEVSALVQRLRTHPERNRRLRWLDDADDASLLACYQQADLLLAASRGEGFGLPLVEAGAHSLPILARDLPVFREVAGDGANYFQGEDAAALADAIEHWLELRRQGRLADPAKIARRTWRECAQALQGQLLGP